MWQVAFSSKSVSWKSVADWPTRDSFVTSATSPSRSAFDRREVAADEVCAGLRLDTDGAALLEGELQSTYDLAREDKRERRTDRPLGAPRVGRSEDLLSRHVRDVVDPRGRIAAARHPARGGQEADGQIRAGPSVAQCIGVEVVELGRPLGEPLEVLLPGLYRIGLVEPHTEGDLLPQPFDVGLAEDLCRPALVRRAYAAPIDVVLGYLLHSDLHDLLRHGATDALAVEICEQLRLRVAGRRDHRVAAHRGGECLQPLGRIRQRLVGAELDHRPARVT